MDQRAKVTNPARGQLSRSRLRMWYISTYGHYIKQASKGMVANPTRRQLNRENVFFPVPFRA